MAEIQILLKKRNIVNDVSAECNLLGRTMEIPTDSDRNPLMELAGYIKSVDDEETKPVVARAVTEGYDIVKECCQRYLVFGREYDDNRLESLTEKTVEQAMETKADICNASNWSDDESGLKRHVFLHLQDVNEEIQKFVLGMDFRPLVPSSLDKPLKAKVVWGDVSKVFDLGTFEQTRFQFSFERLGQENEFTVYLLIEDYATGFPTCSGIGNFIKNYTYVRFGEFNLTLNMPESFNTGVTSAIKSYAHRLIVDKVVAAVLKNQQIEGYKKYLDTAEDARKSLVRILQSRSMFSRRHHDWM